MLMMPAALAAMSMKAIAKNVLARFGYRRVLVWNTVLIGITISAFAMIDQQSPLWLIVMLGLCQGLFNSLQFSSMNSMAYADLPTSDVSMGSTISSSFQQISMSFGLAMGSLTTAWFLNGISQSNQTAVTTAIHHALIVLGILSMLSSVSFWGLHPNDGESVSKGVRRG